MNLIDTIRASMSKFLTYALWAHVVVVAATSMIIGQDGTLWTVLVAIAVAAVPTMIFFVQGTGETQRNFSAISLALMAAILVLVFRGHPWQIDVHMYFFAVLAIVSVYCDPRVIVATATTIAVHHLLFNWVVPSWVFPEGADFGRVMLHAVVVVLESAALFWLALKLRGAFEAVAVAEGIAAEKTGQALAEAAEAATAKAYAEEALAAAELAQTEVSSLENEGDEERNRVAGEALAARVQLADDFEENIGSLLAEMAEVSQQLEEEAELLSSIANDTDAAMRVANGATNNVANNVNSVASSAEEMAASVSEISRQVNMSAGVAGEARQHAEDSEKRIHELADRADKINDVLKMIGDIAEQTNLLALNATIEAARAGEAGKGFAVVASEVKSLASQSANATEEIGKLLAGIREATNGAVEVNKHIVTVVGQISENSASIASAVEEQSAATEEIARAAQHAAADTIDAGRSVENLNEVSEKISKAAEMTAGAVSALSDKTAMLSTRAADFSKAVRG